MRKTNLAGASDSLEMELKINPKLTQAQSMLKAVRESMKQSSGGTPTMARFVPAGAMSQAAR